MKDYREFKLYIRGHKLKGGFFSSSQWFGAFGFFFGNVSAANVSIDNVGFIKARTIPDLFLVVDKLLHAEWPLQRDPEAALRS